MVLFKRFRLQKKYVAFLTVVPLLISTALINVTCPVCQGEGSVLSTPGMEKVELTRIESEEIEVLRDACGMYLLYHYEITMVFRNNGFEDATGYVKLVLIDFTEGKPLDKQYTVLDFPAETAIDVAYNVWFRAGLNEPQKTEVAAEVLTGDIPDETCNGTGTVPINTWFIASSLQDSFRELARIEKPFLPPLDYPSPEW